MVEVMNEVVAELKWYQTQRRFLSRADKALVMRLIAQMPNGLSAVERGEIIGLRGRVSDRIAATELEVL